MKSLVVPQARLLHSSRGRAAEKGFLASMFEKKVRKMTRIAYGKNLFKLS